MASKILKNHRARTSKQVYENYLNANSPSFDSDEWIINGKTRHLYALAQQYGTALKQYDPELFEANYNNWKMKF